MNGLPPKTLVEPAPQWEYLHNHTIATLRLYFIGDQLDPTFPTPVEAVNDIPVPIKRPPPKQGNPRRTFGASEATSALHLPPNPLLKPAPNPRPPGVEGGQPAFALARQTEPTASSNGFAHAVASLTAPSETSDNMKNGGSRGTDDTRFRALLAVRDQLDMLHKFKGTMSDGEMSRRTRDLYGSLPPVPLPTDLPNDGVGDDDVMSQKKRSAK